MKRRRPPSDMVSPSPSPVAPAPRKGARRMADIPPEVLADLNAGRIETVSLVEWLAIDDAQLLSAALASVGLKDCSPALAQLRAVAAEGVLTRTNTIGRAICDLLAKHRRRDALLDGLAGHRSDVVRAWAAVAHACDADVSLADRLRLVRRFAADPHMGVREHAWLSLRPHLAKDLETGLRLLEPWTRDVDANVRRFASEITRPRGVWCQHLQPLKDDPARGEPILEPLRSDLSRYVQNSVANWINDASKSKPAWARTICKRWSRESKTPETAYTVKRALRTLSKDE